MTEQLTMRQVKLDDGSTILAAGEVLEVTAAGGEPKVTMHVKPDEVSIVAEVVTGRKHRGRGGSKPAARRGKEEQADG